MLRVYSVCYVCTVYVTCVQCNVCTVYVMCVQCMLRSTHKTNLTLPQQTEHYCHTEIHGTRSQIPGEVILCHGTSV